MLQRWALFSRCAVDSDRSDGERKGKIWCFGTKPISLIQKRGLVVKGRQSRRSLVTNQWDLVVADNRGTVSVISNSVSNEITSREVIEGKSFLTSSSVC